MKKTILTIISCYLILFFSGTLFCDEIPIIEKGKKVRFSYTLRIDGKEIDTSYGENPLEYNHGEGKLLKGLSSALEGMKVRDDKKIILDPKDAYGDVNPEMIREVERSLFPKDLIFRLGSVVYLKNDKGDEVPGVIRDIRKDSIIVDFNHPLAGKALEFDVYILDIQ